MAGQSSGKRLEVGRGTAETVAELVVVDCEVVEVKMVLDVEVDNDGEEDNPVLESLVKSVDFNFFAARLPPTPPPTAAPITIINTPAVNIIQNVRFLSPQIKGVTAVDEYAGGPLFTNFSSSLAKASLTCRYETGSGACQLRSPSSSWRPSWSGYFGAAIAFVHHELSDGKICKDNERKR